jgi:gas vesicle protein
MDEGVNRTGEGVNGVRNGSDGSAGRFAIGLLVGAAVGAGLGLLFAPKVGSQLRHQIGDQATNLANATTATYRKASGRAATGWKAAKTFYASARNPNANANGHATTAVRG